MSSKKPAEKKAEKGKKATEEKEASSKLCVLIRHGESTAQTAGSSCYVCGCQRVRLYAKDRRVSGCPFEPFWRESGTRIGALASRAGLDRGVSSHSGAADGVPGAFHPAFNLRGS